MPLGMRTPPVGRRRPPRPAGTGSRSGRRCGPGRRRGRRAARCCRRPACRRGGDAQRPGQHGGGRQAAQPDGRQPTTTTRTSAPWRMRSSARRWRRPGATAAPRKDPTMLAARTTPNHHAGASSCRKAKATRKVRKPTMPRSTAMAVADMRTDGACSSASPRRPASGGPRRPPAGPGGTRRPPSPRRPPPPGAPPRARPGTRS